MAKPGDRVGAICRMDETTVELFGYGVYEGDRPVDYGEDLIIPNPYIKLDSGQDVWGYECWWGSEEKIKASLVGKEVVMVDIDIMRANDKSR